MFTFNVCRFLFNTSANLHQSSALNRRYPAGRKHGSLYVGKGSTFELTLSQPRPPSLHACTGCIASPAREERVWWSGCSGHGTEECLEFYFSIIMRMRVHFAAGKKLLHAAAMRQLSCTDHGERRVLHSSANKEVLPVLEKYISQGRINPAMISPIANGGPWICKHPCYKELKRFKNELQTLDIKLRGKIGSTYGVESIPITFRVEQAYFIASSTAACLSSGLFSSFTYHTPFRAKVNVW